MSEEDRWLLPEGIEEALPELAERLEYYRRRILDLFHRWGYELVMPPFIEYLESLLTGTGHDLGLQTFKLTDQLNGRMMGVRADMTPQVARIDAHSLKREVPTRLCYLGTVLHTRSDDFAGTRSPLQVGAELFGHSGPDSDIEIVNLALETFAVAGVRDLYLDFGHVGIYRGLAKEAGLDAEREAIFFDCLQRKSIPDIEHYLDTWQLASGPAGRLRALVELHGGQEVLDEARQVLAGSEASVLEAFDYLERVTGAVRQRHPDLKMHFDLAELRGYHYQTGMVFAAYVQGRGQEIARGGRYDHIGRVFGRARPATGFSTDLRTLVDLVVDETIAPPPAVFAPADDDAVLERAIAELRQAGTPVIRALSGQQGDARAMGCRQELRQRDGDWVVVPLD
ncbi:MAG: ATP phosphoribosyltransferase regulatory subunit [Acidihalobacter sp.]|jgi:ATP phosphoribosyltransferase regulatory subunit